MDSDKFIALCKRLIKEYSIRQTIKKFNKWEKSGPGREMEQERSALREKLGEKENSLAVKRKKNKLLLVFYMLDLKKSTWKIRNRLNSSFGRT
mgnify:CR=1 FL=1